MPSCFQRLADKRPSPALIISIISLVMATGGAFILNPGAGVAGGEWSSDHYEDHDADTAAVGSAFTTGVLRAITIGDGAAPDSAATTESRRYRCVVSLLR